MKKAFLVISLFIILTTPLVAIQYRVTSSITLNDAINKAKPGDEIVLSNGVWKDIAIVFKGSGESAKPIVLKAETAGELFLEGNSSLQISGNFLRVEGLVFRNGFTSRNTLIEFKTSSTEYAYNCVLSNCVVDRFNKPTREAADHWIGLWGKNNRIEYCYFGGKSNEGTTLVVWPEDANSIENHHSIYRNYFGPRPRLGSNGGESIRMGTSTVCTNSSQTTVEGNYFEHCNGEVEIISNKSCDNKILNNTFFECEGSVVLRHGNNALVSGNWFIGNGKPNTGGVRVINEGHRIYNNLFYRLAGTDFRSALTIMNAIPNSPPSGYAAVKNVVVANNTYIDCGRPWNFGVGIGERNRIVKPETTRLVNNLVYCPTSDELIKYYDKIDGISLENNQLVGSAKASKEFPSIQGAITQLKVGSLLLMTTSATGISLPFMQEDIRGNAVTNPIVGAFQNNNASKLEQATAENCGPKWYKNRGVGKPEAPRTVTVEPGIDNLTKAIKNAKTNDVLVLQKGAEYIITNRLKVEKDLTITSLGEKSNERATIKMQLTKANNSMFEIDAQGQFTLKNLQLNGDSKSEFPAKYAIVTSKEPVVGYKLKIDNCEFYDFNVDAGALIKSYKGSMADTLQISNSVLRDSYRGISLAEEKDDTGKYNAEYLILENTVFKNITQFVLDYYRGGNDESTIGGTLKINHCVFDQTANDPKQTILKLSRIENVNIENTIFANSSAKSVVKLSGINSSISNCCFDAIIQPELEKGATKSSLFFDAPKFEKGTYQLSKKSKLKNQATDKGNIGLK